MQRINIMRKEMKNIWALIALLASMASCSDNILPEITELETSRLFSPVDVEVRVVNQTGVRLDWQSVDGAQYYMLEFFENGEGDYSGSPVRTVNEISYDEVPYTVADFDGETAYSVRVKAVGEGIDDSKWVGAVFTTDP